MNILFDLDGTLTDPYEGITKCIEYALVTLGRPSPARSNLKWCIGPPLRNSFATLLDTDDERLKDRAVAIYRERFNESGFFENEVYQGIPEALESLQHYGHTLYVATSKPHVFAKRILAHFGLQRHFKGVYGSELDGTRSDKTSLLSYLLEKEAIDSSQTSMVGDREHDMVGANANGVNCYGVLWGFGIRSELETSGAFASVKKPGELIPLFNK